MSAWDQIDLNRVGANMIADSARADGLPAPFDIVVTEYRVTFQVWTREDVEAYARWRGWDVTDEPGGSPSTRHLRATGSIYDVDLHVVAVVAVKCPECQHPAASHRQVGCQELIGSGDSPRSQRSCACRHATQGAVLAEVARIRSQESHARAMAAVR